MKRIILILLLYGFAAPSNASTPLPKPDHIIILVLENHSYESIRGNINAPYINSLADSGALFTKSYALAHPSSPNYLMLYSGSRQNSVWSDPPKGWPLKTPNLGASLIEAGYTFGAYSEYLKYNGFSGDTNVKYVRRHCPWVFWQGTDTNQIDSNLHKPIDSFPTNFNTLPNVSFVIPSQWFNMHDDTSAKGIKESDNWIKTRIGAYADWALTHNSLLIITFDEDDNGPDNHIFTALYGAHVKRGQYLDSITHYNLLRTLGDMYGIKPIGHADSANPIISCWLPLTGIRNENIEEELNIYPIPGQGHLNISLNEKDAPCFIEVYDGNGKCILSKYTTDSKMNIGLFGIQTGIYLIQVQSNTKVFRKLIPIIAPN